MSCTTPISRHQALPSSLPPLLKSVITCIRVLYSGRSVNRCLGHKTSFLASPLGQIWRRRRSIFPATISLNSGSRYLRSVPVSQVALTDGAVSLMATKATVNSAPTKGERIPDPSGLHGDRKGLPMACCTNRRIRVSRPGLWQHADMRAT